MKADKGIFFRHALVRQPGGNFAAGLSTSGLGPPDIDLAQKQHHAYCLALEACGLEVTVLPPDSGYPDSCFVEDTAVLAGNLAVITNPGAASREGETASMHNALARYFKRFKAISPSGTLEGGDVCRTDRLFLIGISQRTNLDGARQLASILNGKGYDYRFFSLAEESGVLHLKSGMAYLGEGRLAVIRSWLGRIEFAGFDLVTVEMDEAYGANCLRVNRQLLLASGHPRFRSALEGQGYTVQELDMSEFKKMDGGLSCLSLRY